MAVATIPFQIRVPEAVHRELVKLAAREGTSMNYEVNVALRAHIDASKRREK